MNGQGLGLAPLAWPPGTSPAGAAARRWACQALYGLAVGLDAAGDAHTLARVLLAGAGQAWRPGRLAPRLAGIDDAAVPAGQGVDLVALLKRPRARRRGGRAGQAGPAAACRPAGIAWPGRPGPARAARPGGGP